MPEFVATITLRCTIAATNKDLAQGRARQVANSIQLEQKQIYWFSGKIDSVDVEVEEA